jgi:hypothetical protein
MTPLLKKWQNLPDLPAIIILSSFLIIGIFITDDYGVNWDEHSQYNHGFVTAQYINEVCGGCLSEKPLSDIRLEDYKDRTHGVVFQIVALGLQKLLLMDDMREYLLLRHYLTFLIYWISLIFFYKILKKYLKNSYLAVAGILFMILSPRMFAESFYNSKDIVFLSLTIFCTWTLLVLLEKPSFKSAVFHALTSSLLIATRVTGIFMPVVTIFLVTSGFFLIKKDDSRGIKQDFKVKTAWSAGYLAMTVLFLIAFWPYLWQNPWKHFIEIFTSMSHFPWDDPVLFAGKFLSPNALPPSYVPVWIAITTPVIYSILFVTGLFAISFSMKKFLINLDDFVPVVLFIFPLLSVILLHSTLYDGWRQVYFLYVPFMMIALRGFQGILNMVRKVTQNLSTWLYRGFIIVIGILCIDNLVFIIINHPNEQVYFNFLAGKDPVRDYEGDYWGLSYRQDLQFLLDNDPSDSITVCALNWPVKANADIFPENQRKRLVFTDIDKAKYFISNYRFPNEHNKFIDHDYPYNNPVHEIIVRNYRISGIYALNKPQVN